MRLNQSTLLNNIALLFVATKVLDGPIRYTAVSFGLSYFIYIPSLLIVISLIMVFGHGIKKTRVGEIWFYTFYALFFFSIIGLFQIGKPLQVLHGIYIFSPFLFGLLVLRDNSLMKFNNFNIAMWTLSVIGVLIDYFIELPWQGFSYSIGNLNIQGNRYWHTLGFERISGFARTSFDEAIFIMMLSLPLIIYIKYRFLKILIWLASLICIVLTTTKGVLLAYLMVSVLVMLPEYFKHQRLVRLTLIVACLTSFMVPLLSYLGFFTVRYDNKIAKLVLSSFEVRILESWPKAFNIISEHGNFLTGRGMGGIGSSQLYFEPVLYTPGDNFMVSILGLFGIFSVIFICYFIYLTWNLNLKRKEDNYIFLFIIAFLVFGFTTSTLEAPYISLLFGVIINQLITKRF